jgi:cytochrome c oxidase subunit 2
MSDTPLQTGAVQASDFAAQVDHLFYAMLALSAFISVLITLLILVFCIRYRRGAAAQRKPHFESEERLESLLVLIPMLVFIGFFVWGVSLFLQTKTASAGDVLEVRVIGKQWMWMFYQANGARELNQLHLPMGRDILLTLSSEDVIHSLYLPAFRIKQDAVPGLYTDLRLRPNRVGRFRLLCAEYCGTEHSRMNGFVEVMEPEDYSRWLDLHSSKLSLAVQGEKVFSSRGCSGCHAGSSRVHAPSLEGLYGGTVALRNGSMAVADEAYLRDSILIPDKQIVAGFDDIMPAYAGQLSEAELFMLLAYIQSLGVSNR